MTQTDGYTSFIVLKYIKKMEKKWKRLRVNKGHIRMKINCVNERY
jgi:hypothetical protein